MIQYPTMARPISRPDIKRTESPTSPRSRRHGMASHTRSAILFSLHERRGEGLNDFKPEFKSP